MWHTFQPLPSMMAGNYWLENEHIEIDRLLHLLAVTSLLVRLPLLRWHWWDETQIHCQNKQEIYQSQEIVICTFRSLLHDGDKCEIRQVHFQTIDGGFFRLLICFKVAYQFEWRSRIDWQMRCLPEHNLNFQFHIRLHHVSLITKITAIPDRN